jgi:hypothetical protein
MQRYCKGSVRHLVTVHYNGKVEASMQEINKGSVGPSLKHL